MASLWINWLVLSLMITIHKPLLTTEAVRDIGVCYGRLGDNLPPPAEVIALYKQHEIGKMRLFDADPSVLEALRGTNIEVAIGVRNEDLPTIASSQDAANAWFAANVEPHKNDVNIKFTVVGNEAIPGGYANNVAPAIQNLQNVLRSHNKGDIRVTTSVSSAVLHNTYPPSAGEFTSDSLGPMHDVLKAISGQGGDVLMINTYPYFAYASNPANISLDYALFTATKPVFRDGNLDYYYLFDAMVDAAYWAMEKAGFPNIGVAVSESGWPSAGNGDFTTPQLASTYNKNLLHHILSKAGTPKRPGPVTTDAFIFAMFNEDLKPPGVEQNWGLFYPSKTPVYPVF